jgi:hypothetical protein
MKTKIEINDLLNGLIKKHNNYVKGEVSRETKAA